MIARGVNQMAPRSPGGSGCRISGAPAHGVERTAARGERRGELRPRARRHRGRDRSAALALYQPQYDTNEWGPTAVRRAMADRCLATSCDSWWVTRSPSFTMRAPRPGPCGRNCSSPPRMPTPPADLRSRPCALRAGSWGCSSRPWRGAIPRRARSRSSMQRRTWPSPASANPPTCTPARLAVEVRHAAQRLESQNAELEEQHRELSRLNAELDQAGKLKDQFSRTCRTNSARPSTA